MRPLRICGAYLQQLRNLRFRIIDIAKDNCARRTSDLAGRLDLAILNGSPLFLRVELAQLNTLYTEGALLHNTAGTNCDLRVQYHLTQHRVHGGIHILELTVIVILEPVEATYLVRAVVRTIPRTYATIVRHLVQALRTVCGSCYRAYRFARSVVAMLTKHRLENHFRILCSVFEFTPVIDRSVAAVVAVDAQPVHLATVDDFLATHKGNVVLHVTRHHASTATDASVQVDGHSPVMAAILVPLPHGQLARIHFFVRRLPRSYLRVEIVSYEFRIISEGLQRILADNRLTGHVRVMRLRLRKLEPFICKFQFHVDHVIIERSVYERKERVDINPAVVRHPAGSGSAVSEGYADRTGSLTRLHQHGQLQRFAVGVD